MRSFLTCLACLLPFVLGCGGAPPKGTKAKTESNSGVVLLRYNVGSESTEQRERGFLETLEKEHPEVRILSSDQYSGTTAEDSLSKAQQVLLKYGDKVQGIFAVCEPNANGVLEALEQESLAGKVKFIGFDPNERMVKALAARKMEGIVLQDPVTMGALAVKAMIAHLEPELLSEKDKELVMEGGKVKHRIPTGEHIATPENMNEPRTAELLNPQQFEGVAQSLDKPKYRLAVIPKGTSHEFWKSVHYGAQQAADEIGGIEILWKGTNNEGDRDGQISLVQNFITAKVDGICLAPLDSQALVSVVQEAKDAKIPTVIFDSGLEDETVYVSYVATDNYHGGVLAARRLAEVLQGK
jgi:ABC-type sugar transport system substrate-binding protein